MSNLSEPAFKKAKLEEPEESGVKVNDLPELPFELILSYLSLEERIKVRVVSRRWYRTINSFKPKSLCFSDRPSGFIYGKSRWVSGAFAQNFIHSKRFEPFFQTFRQSILLNLKHLRLCDLLFPEANSFEDNFSTVLAQIINSFDRLEELDIIRFTFSRESGQEIDLELKLPMLNSIQLEDLNEIYQLTLYAPKLRNVKMAKCDCLYLDLAYPESVERLFTNRGCDEDMDDIELKDLKSLKYLYRKNWQEIDSTLLSDLEQLKEIHLFEPENVSELFEQKRRYGRSELKIFLCGLLLDGPNDQRSISGDSYNRNLRFLADHVSRLAKEIPYNGSYFPYRAIESAELEINIINRLTDLDEICVHAPVEHIERFLNILKNSNHIVKLHFSADQPQELFDRLPDYGVIQKLEIHTVTDFGWLSRFKNLRHLYISCSIDVDSVRKIFEENLFLLYFSFKYHKKRVAIEAEHPYRFKVEHPKPFDVYVRLLEATVPDLDAAIRLIVENA